MNPLEWIVLFLSIPGAIASTLDILQTIRERIERNKKDPPESHQDA